MECWQAVTEFRIWIACYSHHIRIDLEWFKEVNPFFPHIVSIAHRYPYAGINYIKTFNAFCHIICACNRSSCFLCYLQAFFIERTSWPELFRTDEAKIHAHFHGTAHQSVTHIGLTMAYIGIGNFVQWFIDIFLQCKEISQCLCRMIHIG